MKLKQTKNSSGGWIDFPYDLKKTYGVGNLVPFIAKFDNRVIYRGSLAKMGGDCAMILLRKDIFAEIGKKSGEMVDIVITLDDKREVYVPDYLNKILQESNVWETFSKLSFTHRKEYIEWIESAKKQETRETRLSKIVNRLRIGMKTPY